LQQNINAVIIENKVYDVQFGFGWMGKMPMPQGWAHMHIKQAIEAHDTKSKLEKLLKEENNGKVQD
jgi:hypothetical protein